jgi:hypothetical protein
MVTQLITPTRRTRYCSTRQPSYVAYIVRGRKGPKDYRNKIGALFPHKDGKGFDRTLDGKLVVRLPKEVERQIQA